MITEHFFDSRDELFAALNQHCIEQLRTSLQQHQQASLLASGGSTPAPLYERLSKADLDWSKVDVALVDERWVDGEHAGSNEAFIHRTLLQDQAQAANFVPMKNSHSSPAKGVAACEAAYQKLHRPFTLNILGMGPDGHTASLFPHAEGLREALSSDKLCAAITANRSEVTGELVERMTLSLHGILQSQSLVLLITGQEKLKVYQQARDGNPLDTPVSAVLQQQQIPVSVYWAP